MSTKHTPGPWTMHPRFDDDAEVRSLASVSASTSQEVIDKSDALIPRLALLDGLQRSVAHSDVLREAIRRGLVNMKRTLPTLTTKEEVTHD